MKTTNTKTNRTRYFLISILSIVFLLILINVQDDKGEEPDEQIFLLPGNWDSDPIASSSLDLSVEEYKIREMSNPAYGETSSKKYAVVVIGGQVNECLSANYEVYDHVDFKIYTTDLSLDSRYEFASTVQDQYETEKPSLDDYRRTDNQMFQRGDYYRHLVIVQETGEVSRIETSCKRTVYSIGFGDDREGALRSAGYHLSQQTNLKVGKTYDELNVIRHTELW